jgi:uncharacterized membrane protein
MELTASLTVGKEPDEVFAFWRKLDNLPSFMAHVDEVTTSDDGRSHWRVSAPFGRDVEWAAEIIDEQPGSRLEWRSIDGAEVDNSGLITFVPAPKGQGTEVHVRIRYEVPGGVLGKALARWAGEDPRQQIDDDLRRFKQVMETGEVVRSDGAPWGKQARKEFPQRPAQPMSADEVIDLTEHDEVPA